jgi:hypothetical protein
MGGRKGKATVQLSISMKGHIMEAQRQERKNDRSDQEFLHPTLNTEQSKEDQHTDGPEEQSSGRNQTSSGRGQAARR